MLRRRCGNRAREPLGIVGQDAEIGRGGAEALDEPSEQIAIGVEQRGTRSRRPRLDDFVAGREHGDAHAAEHVERSQADGGRERDVLRGEPPACRQHDRSGAYVLACEASICSDF